MHFANALDGEIFFGVKASSSQVLLPIVDRDLQHLCISHRICRNSGSLQMPAMGQIGSVTVERRLFPCKALLTHAKVLTKESPLHSHKSGEMASGIKLAKEKEYGSSLISLIS